MDNIAELELVHLPVDEQQFRRDPMPWIKAARAKHPWLAITDYGYFVHGYEAIKDLIYMDDKMKPSFDELVEYYGVQGTPWAKFQVEQILGHTGEKHRRIRLSVGDAFTPRNVNKHIDVIRRNASTLLDEWAPKGAFDFTEFAAYYPVSVLCALLGTTTEEIPSIRHALETQTRLTSMDHAIVPDLLAGYHVLYNFCDKLIVEREKEGLKDGLLDQLIRAKDNGKMDEEELRYLLMILFPAGYDTSKNMLGLIMHQMLQTPEHWERCAESIEYSHKVTEEIFRHTSTATMSRVVTQDLDYKDVHIPAKTALIFGNSTAGRDPEGFGEDAELFNPERNHVNRHVAFGRGAHICLGQHMAKIQIAEGIHLMAQRIKNPRLAGEIEWRPFLGVWGLETLPIEFDPA